MDEKKESDALILQREFGYQNEEKEKRAAELVIANAELIFQNREKEKRAAELVIANEELVYQNNEKEKRAAELVIANAELIFQNQEKEKRAAELVIANSELVLQNNEKEKRASELIIANEELIYQNDEKEKRAAELVIANAELIFQNQEKEKRAEELDLANNTLILQNNEKEKRAAELALSNKELKKAEEGIRKLNKELESFSYSVSHDLRAPLRAIHGYAQILKEDFEHALDPEANRLINNVMSNAKKMGQLIDDLLTFSRLGRKELIKKSTSMNTIVRDICAELTNESSLFIPEFHIADLPSAQADIATLKHVWFNLISNAVKYSKLKEKPFIEIGASIKRNEIIYHIKDNGAGFDMRYAGKLFGVFQRLHSDEAFEGTGVGLAIVHRIISKHGGRVWAEGKVDEGATFHFSLPRNSAKFNEDIHEDAPE